MDCISKALLMDNIYYECRDPQAINWLADETGNRQSWQLAGIDR